MQKSLRLIWLLALSLLITLEGTHTSAQTYYLQYGHDSMGNRTARSRHLVIRGDEAPSIAYADTALRRNWWAPHPDEATPGYGVLLADNASRLGRLIKTPEQKQAYLDAAIKEVESLKPITTGRSRDITSYDVGAILLAYGLSPSGARTYSVPILTAPDIKYAPSLSLVYNSQGSHGYGGYGWDIAGVSEIRLASRSLYYDDEIRAASALDTAAVFTLDGVRLVRNDDLSTMATYPLVTATGRILVAPHRNSHGFVSWFQALYPDGTVARYGTAQDVAYQMPSYPIVRSTSLEGEKIEYVYSVDTQDGNHTLTQVRYGFNAAGTVADGVITLSSTPQTAYGYYAGKKVKRAPLLSGIVSSIGNTGLYTYGLQYESVFGASLLTSITLTNGSGHQLPPLSFTYGHTASPHPGNDSLKVSHSYQLEQPVTLLLNHILRRGKFISGNYNDGIVAYWDIPTYSNPSVDVYSCSYPVNAPIQYVASVSDTTNLETYIITDSGFLTAEAVDVDGDGADELVEVYCNATGSDGSTLLIRIRKCNDDGELVLSYSLNVFIPGSIGSHGPFSPYLRTFRWGDFVGNGKAQLLVVNFIDNSFGCSQDPYTTLIDLTDGTKLYYGVPFTLASNSDKHLIATDIDGDSRSELCLATSAGLKKFRFASGSFILEHTYSEISQSFITSANVFFTDINSDGYVDIVKPTPPGGVWTMMLNTGLSFESKTVYITNPGTSSFFFMDINRDGLPDIIKVTGTEMGYYLNLDGASFDYYRQSYSTISDLEGILPGNVVDYTSMSCFIKVDNYCINEYFFTSYAPENRQLVQSQDSYGKTIRNTYTYLPHSAPYWSEYPDWTDTTGYQLRTPPTYVLKGSVGFLSDTIQSDTFLQEAYSWSDAVTNTRGLGFCGFSKTESVKTRTPARITLNRFAPRRAGVPVSTSQHLYNTHNQPYSHTYYTFDNHSTTYGKLSPRLIRSVTSDNLTGIVSATSVTYDTYDYPLTVTESGRVGSGDSLWRARSVVYCHSNDTTRYVLGNVSAETLRTERDGNASTQWYEKTVCTYDSLFHPLTRVRSLSQNGSTYNTVSTEQWTYDAHGNVLTEKAAPYSSEEFIGNTYTYDTSGRHLLTSTDALGHTTTYSGFNVYGSPYTATDYRSRVTSITYDSWGNRTSSSYPDGTVDSTAVAWGGTGLYEIVHTMTGMPDAKADYDALGREVRRSDRRFDGQWRHVVTTYNSFGQVSSVTQAFREGGTPGEMAYHLYDEYGRPTRTKHTNGSITTWSYNGTSVTETNAGITITRTTNAFGDLVGSEDAGGTVGYTLRDDGNPASVLVLCNSSSARTTFSYDAYGRRTAIVDPSAGTRATSYTWNTDGSSSTTQTNDKGSITTSLDKYGRVTGITRSSSFNTTYNYDTYGRLVSETSTNSTGVVYSYDAYDRPDTVMQYVPDSKWLRKAYTYGAGSNVASIGYTSQDGYITTESYTYTYGHNTSITLPGGTEILTLVAENDLGQSTSATSAGISRTYEYSSEGYPTARKMDGGALQHLTTAFNTLTGNLSSRGRQAPGQTSISESFTYDDLGRLLTFKWFGSMTYAANGNILEKSDAGSYTYHILRNDPKMINRLYESSSSAIQPYTQSVTYTSFDRPATISENGNTVTFTYDAGYDRVKMATTDGTTTQNKYYIGGRYESEETLSGDTVQRLFLGGDAYSAPMVLQKNDTSAWTPYVIGRDYLGSITHIVSTSGTLVEEYSYDAWGRMRNPKTFVVYPISSEPSLMLGRGYCGHEHLPLFGLINMNARLYDPFLGRFLSPDPYVQAPDFTQNFNRYSYALNNPLKYSDESGEFAITTMLIVAGISAVIFGAGNLAAHAIREDDLSNGKWADYFFSGAFAGFAVGALAYVGVAGMVGLSALPGVLGNLGRIAIGATATGAGLTMVATTASLIGGAINKGWNGVANAGKVFLGNFYLDENKSFWGQVGEGISRHTWESLQTGLGYDYTQFRNAFGSSIDRVDFMAGATFATNEYYTKGGSQGITLGNYCNMDITGAIGSTSFDSYVTNHPLYMHEYGHTIDGKTQGLAYLFSVGIPSLNSARNSVPIPGKYAETHDYKPYEMRANRNSEIYFGRHYGVSWRTAYLLADYEAYYPTHW